MSELNFHELDTIMTRVGQDSKIIFSGDFFQSDLVKSSDKEGMVHFMDILQRWKSLHQLNLILGHCSVWFGKKLSGSVNKKGD